MRCALSLGLAVAFVTASAASAQPPAPAQVLGSTRNSREATSVQGRVLDSKNTPMGDSPVRLRDARLGRIVATQRTDRAGAFAFRGLEPGNYVVEVLTPDGRVLAASDLLNVNAGDAATTLVHLPLRVPPVSSIVRRALPLASTVSAVAAAAGILGSEPPPNDVSPQ